MIRKKGRREFYNDERIYGFCFFSSFRVIREGFYRDASLLYNWHNTCLMDSHLTVSVHLDSYS